MIRDPRTVIARFMLAASLAVPIAIANYPAAQATGGESPGQTVTMDGLRTDEGDSSISGRLAFRAAPDSEAQVEACVHQGDGRLIDCRQTAEIAANGKYTIANLLPDRPYVVRAHAKGYLETYYGDTTGPAVQLDRSTVTTAPGQEVVGIDIALVEPFTVTGLVVPAQPHGNLDARVLACPLYEMGSDRPYLGSNCESTNVSDVSGDYALDLSPGQPYALIGRADGYTDIWYGGLVADLPEQGLDVPDPDQIESLSGAAGQTRSGINLVFADRLPTVAPAIPATPISLTPAAVSNIIWAALIGLTILVTGVLAFIIFVNRRPSAHPPADHPTPDSP